MRTSCSACFAIFRARTARIGSQRNRHLHVHSKTSLRCLHQDSALIEYFIVKDQFVAAIVTASSVEVLPLTPVSRVAESCANAAIPDVQVSARFQLHAAFRKNSVRGHPFSSPGPLSRADRSVPRAAACETSDDCSAWHFALSAFSRALRRDALFDRRVFNLLCAEREHLRALLPQRVALVGTTAYLGRPRFARSVYRERKCTPLRAALQGSRLVLGAEAGDEALRTTGAQSRLVHIATHGIFRQDNPMFSGIRLGASYLNLYDLYHLKLDAELVTLSGCATGLNVIAAGDELLGLVRGLLYAGTQSVLLTFWDVNDKSTSEFMASFYSRLGSGETRGCRVARRSPSASRVLSPSLLLGPFRPHWQSSLSRGRLAREQGRLPDFTAVPYIADL